MQEKVNAKLSGQVYETKSSDSAISKHIELIRSGLNATQGSLQLIADADIYPPIPVVNRDVSGNNEELTENQKVVQFKSLSHKDSAFARRKLLERLGKKAA